MYICAYLPDLVPLSAVEVSSESEAEMPFAVMQILPLAAQV